MNQDNRPNPDDLTQDERDAILKLIGSGKSISYWSAYKIVKLQAAAARHQANIIISDSVNTDAPRPQAEPQEKPILRRIAGRLWKYDLGPTGVTYLFESWN